MMGLIIDESHQNKGLVLEYCSGKLFNFFLWKFFGNYMYLVKMTELRIYTVASSVSFLGNL